MKTPQTGAAILSIWLAAIPAIAQPANPPKGSQKPVPVAASAPPSPAKPAASPEELSHQAMVEEQERRDREAEAERDRDDQG